jgi:hypothetical protein
MFMTLKIYFILKINIMSFGHNDLEEIFFLPHNNKFYNG